MTQAKEPAVVIILRRKWLIAQLINFITLWLAMIVLWQYIGYVDGQRNRQEREKDQQFCQLFGRLDKQYQQTPPPTEQGQVFADDIHALVESLNCPN